MVKKITIYLDTNILRDAMARRNKDSTYWLNRIKEKNWTCITSVLGITELIDIDQDHSYVNRQLSRHVDFDRIYRDKYHRNLDVSEFQTIKDAVSNFLSEYSFIKVVSLDDDAWKLFLHISSNSNLFSPDAIHLAAAWRNSADLIITSDSHFIEEGTKLLEQEKVKSKLRICNPQQVRKTLKKMKVCV